MRAPCHVSVLIGVSLAACVSLAVACGGGREGATDAAALPTWTFDSSMVFPADRSLERPEDGVALADGRLLVADQTSGLRLVELDGTSKPFGDMAKAGYMHHPPDHPGGANGVSLEPAGTHVLVADAIAGAIYRVDVQTGAAELLYDHPFGVNTAVRDASGTIWFTQSTRNGSDGSELRLYAAIDRPIPDGAVLRLPSQDGKLAAEPVVVQDSLLFANGISLDEAGGVVYVAETLASRVLRFRVDMATGRVKERTIFAEVPFPDNVELDDTGQVWVVSPLNSQVVIVNPATGSRHTAFQSQTPEQAEGAKEFLRRGEAGESRIGLIVPDAWAPLPGSITGVIFTPNFGPVYVSGLGNALLKLPR